MCSFEFINEIDYTPGIEPLQISFEQLFSNSKIIGNMDLRDVWLDDDGSFQAYFTKTDDNVDGIIIMCGNKLHGIRNYSGIPGMITLLVGFVVHCLGIKIHIGKDEPLTSNGLKWLCSLLRAGGRGLTITDQIGNFPDADQIEKEWVTAMKGTTHGLTEIFIESKMTRKLRTKEEWLSEGRTLTRNTWFIGDTNIL